MKLTVRDIQKIQSALVPLGYQSRPNTDGIGLLDRSAGYLATKAESDADYLAHMNFIVPTIGYLAKPYATDDQFPDFQRAYASTVQTINSETDDLNDKYRVMLWVAPFGKAGHMIPADLVTKEALTELFSE